MPSQRVEAALLDKLYRQANASRWQLPADRFAETLETSAARMFAGRAASARELERYLASLRLEDLALACACAAGHEAAWDHFVLEYRPILYRAADALEPGGGARELADSLYGDLYGLGNREGERNSLFRYFHGRSSLATWLRAVLAQRLVDRVRAGRRTRPLPEEEPAAPESSAADPDRNRYLALIQAALGNAVAALDPRDRLRLRYYYAQELTLAETGRLLREHEATVSRHLARTRKTIRREVERQLHAAALSAEQIDRCFECVTRDAGPLDLDDLLAETAGDARNPEPIVLSKKAKP
jgi:RNA polymerase sigma-70 factor (ECF subfamily)